MEAPSGICVEEIGYFTANFCERAEKKRQKALARRIKRRQEKKEEKIINKSSESMQILRTKLYKEYLERRNKPEIGIELTILKYSKEAEKRKINYSELANSLAKKGISFKIKARLTEKTSIKCSIPLKNIENIIKLKKKESAKLPPTPGKNIDFERLWNKVKRSKRVIDSDSELSECEIKENLKLRPKRLFIESDDE